MTQLLMTENENKTRHGEIWETITKLQVRKRKTLVSDP